MVGDTRLWAICSLWFLSTWTLTGDLDLSEG
jgi:hypothetical protein